MFKEGDIVYCINNNWFFHTNESPIQQSLCKNIPYIIKSCYNDGTIRLSSILKSFSESRFISENDYKMLIRKDKIKQLKENICLKKVI